MIERFSIAEQKRLQRVVMLRDLLTEQEFHDAPCPLLASQLAAAIIFAERFISEAQGVLGRIKSTEGGA